ncbi:MAG: hypothetical protein H7Y60_01535 [Rhodospirillaceae bacterium]|nr:hypothetical protein [Rhodospirillales bacterium]
MPGVSACPAPATTTESASAKEQAEPATPTYPMTSTPLAEPFGQDTGSDTGGAGDLDNGAGASPVSGEAENGGATTGAASDSPLPVTGEAETIATPSAVDDGQAAVTGETGGSSVLVEEPAGAAIANGETGGSSVGGSGPNLVDGAEGGGAEGLSGGNTASDTTPSGAEATNLPAGSSSATTVQTGGSDVAGALDGAVGTTGAETAQLPLSNRSEGCQQNTGDPACAGLASVPEEER